MKDEFIIVPKHQLEEILKNQSEIIRKLNHISNSEKKVTPKYISETEAKEILKKKTTWFWQQRTNGVLPYSKVGNQIFYKLEDIEKLFEDSICKF
jgi:hypothetical protein